MKLRWHNHCTKLCYNSTHAN